VKVDLEVLDSFIDGEQVDELDVKSALATPDGRDYLVDAWRLRQVVQAETPVSSEAFSLSSPSASKPLRRAGRPWLLAAGIAASLLGGFYAGRLGGKPVPLVVQAPAPTVSPVLASGAFPVPAPTRVIQLEFTSPATTSGGD
jgi:hypothetical protein